MKGKLNYGRTNPEFLNEKDILGMKLKTVSESDAFFIL